MQENVDKGIKIQMPPFFLSLTVREKRYALRFLDQEILRRKDQKAFSYFSWMSRNLGNGPCTANIDKRRNCISAYKKQSFCGGRNKFSRLREISENLFFYKMGGNFSGRKWDAFSKRLFNKSCFQVPRPDTNT
ncbi:hypothetical protein CEXT_270511 [Caerostris extrusa]|uniref:Uncharacterized protein n=1 Tax=Caerostris extrusa TaxID=172846 RepID=A0AAV4XP37_CAEEX|nr:hypothetical protein CEXT_270511 [Caerostris extrusa]